MDNVDKLALLQELKFYSRLLRKHEISKKEKELTSAIIQQTNINQQHNKRKTFHNYSIGENQSNPALCYNQTPTFQKSSHFNISDHTTHKGLYKQRYIFNPKYSLSKTKMPINVSSANKVLVNSKNFNRSVSVRNTKPISTSKSETTMTSHVSSSTGSKRSTYNAKDFIKEVESLTELLKKKTSENPSRILNSSSKHDNVTHNKQLTLKKDQNCAFSNTVLQKDETLSKAKKLVEMPSKVSANINYVNRKPYLMIPNNKGKPLQPKVLNSTKFVYKKNNVKQSLNGCTTMSLQNIKSKHKSKDELENSAVDKLEKNLLAISSELTAPLSTKKREDNKAKIIQPLMPKVNSKMDTKRKEELENSAVEKLEKNLLAISSELTAPLSSKIKEDNKNKIIQPLMSKVNSKINVERRDKLERFAVEKLEKNVLTISSELTVSPSSKKKEDNHEKIIQPLIYKNSKVGTTKRRHFKKTNSKFSHYKIINSNVSRLTSRKVIFSNTKHVSRTVCTPGRAGMFQIKPLPSNTHDIFMKLHTPNKIFSTKKVLKKSPHITKLKSPILVKIKSFNTTKVPIRIKQKQTNTRYTKINKHLTPPNKSVHQERCIQYKSSLRKSKRKVSSKYKVINKTLAPNMNKKGESSLSTKSVNKEKVSLSMNCETFLEALNNSAVEKLEKNLLAISSELTAPLSLKEKEEHHSKIIQPLIRKVNCKINAKGTPFKTSKSKFSKYKIINSNVPQKYPIRNMEALHMVAPLKRERAVLVRRIFKSKNVIINKNTTPTSYSAKMIKSKYLSLNKRKSPSWQKYVYPTVSQHSKFQGSYLANNFHFKQKKFKTNAVLMQHYRLIGKTNFRSRTNKLIYKNSRQMKNKFNNRYARAPVVFIQGTKYAINLNGKALRKLPSKGHIAKNFQRTSANWIMKTPENLTKSSSANLASRALNRSINRILTASSKKKLSKVNTYCMFYNRFGRCNRGVKCTYIHDPSKIAVCTRFLRGTCKIDGCPFSHEIDPGKMAVCSFFLVGQCNKENCPYRHEKLSPNAVLCKDFVQGYCRFGKECKKAHILMCPKYMQGECDEGSSCAFPHPPQKAKKNIQREVEDKETKPTEVLLEKVLRYFQEGGDAESKLSESCATKFFVPKQRKLEEQPSFIPLSDSSTVL